MNKKPFLITGVFLVLAAAAIVIGVKSRSAGASYNDGEWTGTAEGRNGPITLSLTVKGGKVVSGQVVSEDETDFAKPAEQKLIEQADGIAGGQCNCKACRQRGSQEFFHPVLFILKINNNTVGLIIRISFVRAF